MGHGQHILEEASKKKSSEIGALSVWDNFFLHWPSKRCRTLLSNRCLGGLGSELALQLHKLQNHAARIINFSNYDSTSGPLLQELGWDLLSMRRIKLLAIEKCSKCTIIWNLNSYAKILWKWGPPVILGVSPLDFSRLFPKSIMAKNVFATRAHSFGIN